MNNLNFFAEITKYDPDQRMVYGYASTTALDSQGERVAKEAIEAALPDYLKFANIREMHTTSAVGVAKETTLDEKGLYIGAKIVDDNAWKKVKEGVYKGFSIGGKRLSKVDDTITEMKLTEISLVDRPANPEATFDVFKADDGVITGNMENSRIAGDVVKIAERSDVNPKEGEKKYGKVKFADPKNKKYPIDTEAHIRAAWSYINQARNASKYSSEDVAAIKRRIVAAWKQKINASGPPEATEKMESTDLQKGLYEVSQLACLLAGLDSLESAVSWEAEMEQDRSPLPAKLKNAITNLGNILRAMVDEEVDELLTDEDITMSETTQDIAKADAILAKLNEMTDSMQKLADANAQLKQDNETLQKRMQELEAQPAAAKASLTVIAKGDDVLSEDVQQELEFYKGAEVNNKDHICKAIKFAQTRPSFPLMQKL
jgi:phage head maturation protease/regulator of replication initiation timing